MDAALEAGADDVVSHDDDSIDVLTSPENYQQVKDAIDAAELEPVGSEVTMRPDILTEVSAEDGEKILRIVDILEDLDDVQEVFTNADIPEEALEAAG